MKNPVSLCLEESLSLPHFRRTALLDIAISFGSLFLIFIFVALFLHHPTPFWPEKSLENPLIVLWGSPFAGQIPLPFLLSKYFRCPMWPLYNWCGFFKFLFFVILCISFCGVHWLVLVWGNFSHYFLINFVVLSLPLILLGLHNVLLFVLMVFHKPLKLSLLFFFLFKFLLFSIISNELFPFADFFFYFI